MLFEVGDETLAKIEQLGAGFLGDLAADVRILVEPLVIGIGAIVFFTNDRGCAKDDPGANAVDFFNHVPEATLKSFGGGAFFASGNHPRVGPVPDVVNANVDEDDGGLFLQHVLVETLLAISNFMATDASTDELDVEVRVGLGNGLGTEGDVATRAGPAAVIESPRKTMRSFFFSAACLAWRQVARERMDSVVMSMNFMLVFMVCC